MSGTKLLSNLCCCLARTKAISSAANRLDDFGNRRIPLNALPKLRNLHDEGAGLGDVAEAAPAPEQRTPTAALSRTCVQPRRDRTLARTSPNILATAHRAEFQ